MFALFKKKNPHKESALALYGACMDQSRDAWFYTEGGVPDSYDGRFDCLLLHLYLVIQRLNESEEGRALAQELFDAALADFDQSLREIGVGDTGMKRRMKNMMLAFNGRMHAYDAARQSGGAQAWEEALARNLYGTLETVEPGVVSLMRIYVDQTLVFLENQEGQALEDGAVDFPVPGNAGDK